MGNCQAAEAATVVIVRPHGSKVERIYWSVSARQVMDSNPGHYVAHVVSSSAIRTENGLPVKQLKLLRPDDTLLMGQVYRLISFEDVLKEFAAKKCVKLGKLLRERGVIGLEKKKDAAGDSAPALSSPANKNESHKMCHEGTNSSGSSRTRVGRRQHHQNHGAGGQWKPALKSISEIAN